MYFHEKNCQINGNFIHFEYFHVKNLWFGRFSRIYKNSIHSAEITEIYPPQCRNYRNLLSLYFGKNFVKPTYILTKEITK